MNEYRKNNCCSYIYYYITSFYNNIKNNNIKDKIESRIDPFEKHRFTKATFIGSSHTETEKVNEPYHTESDKLNLNYTKYSLNEPSNFESKYSKFGMLLHSNGKAITVNEPYQIIKETIIEKLPLINKDIIIDIDDDFEIINHEQ